MNQSMIARPVFRGIRLSVAAGLLVLLVGLLAITQPARALPYEVTNSNDSGAGSLRQAISDANNNPGPDIITFAAATDGIPIVLAGAADENGNASGDLDILDGGDLTIQGNGVANSIIDGGGIDRVFHICPGGGCASTVTFMGVTIRNGSGTKYGGGIYNVAGTTTVDGSTISANMATYGGGIYNQGTLNVQNGSSVGGTGTGNTARFAGGGISNRAGTTTVDGSTVSANTSSDEGGGIHNWGGTLNVQNGSSVSANIASSAGGGIYNLGGTTTVDGSSVSDNTADNGGGIHNPTDSTLNVQSDSIVSVNKAVYGGGINNSGTTTVDGSTVSDNTADYGGGIENEGTLKVDNSTVSDNTADYGGGIENGGTLKVQSDSIVSANEADTAGGGIANRGTTMVNGSTVSANTAYGGGGGIYNQSGTTTVDCSHILNNTDGNSGGVKNINDVAGATSVTSSSIVGNSATSYFNNKPAQQIGSGNWWGVATGPNTPGADTVGGNVDVSGHLTAPILVCATSAYLYLPVVLK